MIKVPRFDQFAPSSENASKTARAIRNADTKAETVLRRALWRLGLRYRKDVRSLPGRPDVVFARAKVVVFCDGDFWHGRDWESRAKKLAAGSNAPYWLAKIRSNIERDARTTVALVEAGWLVVRVWETDVLRDPEAAAEHVRSAVKARL